MSDKKKNSVPPSFEKTLGQRMAGQMFDPQEARAVGLATNLKRTQALIFAILDHCGGEVTLSKAESERVNDESALHFERTPEGGLRLWLEPFSPTEPRH